jgi:hypothetical protein
MSVISTYNFINMKGLKTICFLIACGSLLACRKGAGEGGDCTITGRVYGNYYNKNFSVKTASEYAPLQDVYIIFDNDITFGTNQKTNYDGTYSFRYLRPGNYKIYAYSRDSTGAAAINKGVSAAALNPAPLAIIKEVQIGSSNQTVKVPDLIVIPK